MLSRGVLAIGLLVCANITNAYILFSANIEDIKKVASKFLSSDVVDQLTSLISKIKTDVKNNLSEENTVNENTINKVSDDDIEERAPIYKQPNTINRETERDRYELVSMNKEETERDRHKHASMDKYETETDRHKLASMNRDESGKDRHRLAYMNKDETERDRHRLASMDKYETERDRHRLASMNRDESGRDSHRLAYMNKDETERDKYKHVSMNIVSQEEKSYRNVINQVKDDIDRGMLQTTHTLRERKIDRQEERERKNKKARVRDDLYWNDDKVDGSQVDRVVATSGRIKLPDNGKREYNWEISSDN